MCVRGGRLAGWWSVCEGGGGQAGRVVEYV